MESNRYFTNNSKTIKSIEAGSQLLSFMAFNLSESVVVNRLYVESDGNRILYHFTFRECNWLLRYTIDTDEWDIQKCGNKGYRFTKFTKQAIIDGNF